MDRLNRFVSSEGRISRRTYVLTFLLPLLALAALSALVLALPLAGGGGLAPSLLILPWMAFLACADAQNIKRWRDLGDPGRLYRLLRPGVVLLPALALGLQFVLPAFAASAGDADALAFMMGQDLGGVKFGAAPLALLGVTAAGATANIAWLAAIPGQAGANAYGPDPLALASVPGLGPSAHANSHGAPLAGDDDPVKRALEAYHASLAQKPTPAMPARQARPAAGGAFGRKRA